jgi:hypothetical protein
MRGLAIAAAVGAGLGALAGSAAFMTVTWGTDIYYRAVSWRETRRELRSAL